MRVLGVFGVALIVAAGVGCGADALEHDASIAAADAGAPFEDAALDDAAIEDASLEDAALEDASSPLDDAMSSGAARYVFGRDHSPITAHVAENLRSIRGSNPGADPRLFAKIGDSITVSNAFLRCFAGTRYDLADHLELAAARDHFAAGDAAGTTPFDRDSVAAVVGWSAWAPLRDDPTPLALELDALDPAFAVVMFGTNDIDTMNLVFYGENMLALVDALLDRGVIPILSSIPPRDDYPAAAAEVARYSLVARALAEARQLPFIDLEQHMRPLANHGLGGDGVHPNSDPRGACKLDETGLGYGYNVRNLLTLEALDRLRRAVILEESSLDPDGAPRPGSGTRDDPVLIDTLPYTDARNTALTGERHIDRYACGDQNESGAEVYYRLELDTAKTVRAVVIDRPGVDIDLHHLAGDFTGEACTDRHDRRLTLALEPGVHYFVLDTFNGDTNAGEYLLTIDEE